jgi:hypothetical protein
MKTMHVELTIFSNSSKVLGGSLEKKLMVEVLFDCRALCTTGLFLKVSKEK